MFAQGKRNYRRLKKLSGQMGIDLFGVAEIGELKEQFSFGAGVSRPLAYACCMGVRVSSSVLEEIMDAPTRLYFHHYRTINMFLDQAALRVAQAVHRQGYRALPVPASQILDWQKQRAHLSHKELAARAGLGWIGRNNLLVHPRFGAQLRLVTVLTDLPLPADRPLAGGCGACRLCMKHCPAQAIGERREDFNHLACYDKLKEFQRKRLVDQYICGICVRHCPGSLS